MEMLMKQRSWVATFALVALIPITANAEMSAEELAKLAQNRAAGR
jgi:hypothetical protein